MVFEYVTGIVSILAASFCLAIISLQFNFANGTGFNIFELLFLIGVMSFIVVFIIDISYQTYIVCRKCIQNSLTAANGTNPAAANAANNNNNNNNNVTISLANNNNNGNGNNNNNPIPNDTTPLLPAATAAAAQAQAPPAVAVTTAPPVNNNDAMGNPIGEILTNSKLYKTFSSLGPLSRRWLFLRGFLKTISIILFLYSIYLIKFNDSIVIFYTSPVWGLFYDAYLFNYDVLPFHYFVSIVAIFGSVLALQPEFVFESSHAGKPTFYQIVGYVFTILCSIIQAGAYAAMRRFTILQNNGINNNVIMINGNGNNDNNGVFINLAGIYSIALNLILIGAIGSFLFYQAFLYETIVSEKETIGLYFYLCMGSISVAIVFSMYCINYGVSKLNINETALLTMSGVIWIYVFEIVFVRDTYLVITDWVGLGGIITVIFTITLMFSFNIRDIMNMNNGGNGNNGHNHNNLNFMATLLNAVAVNHNHNGNGMNGMGPMGQTSAISSTSSKSMESMTSHLYSGEFGASQ